MSFINARLPRRISAGLRIGPEWRTQVVDLDNGREVRNAQWLYPRWRASGNMGAFSETDRAELRRLFVAARGKLYAFRVYDPVDYSAAGEVIAPSVGTTTPVQLIKTYTFPGDSSGVTIKVTAPVAGSVTVFRDGTAVAGTLDASTGLFTPSTTWLAGAYTWTGQFDRWMRFDSDWGSLTANALNAYTADIELVEVRR